MTALWTSQQAMEATGGTVSTDWTAGGVCIDSRKIEKGDLFIAIVGPNNDGHDYLENAHKAGAAAAMVDQDHAEAAATIGIPLLVVEDCYKGLTDLAKSARNRTKAKIIGVTGSVGKTGTKESLAKSLSAFGKCHATIGNLNNEFGLPLTMARMPADCDFAVLEMGMNHPGEIEPLSLLARPHLAVITTVQPVHLEFFEGVHDIADAKAEIFAGLEKNGQLLLPRDHPLFHYLRGKAVAMEIDEAGIFGFGAHWEADFQLTDYVLKDLVGEVSAEAQGEKLTYELGMPGFHWAINSLIILGTAKLWGLDLAKAMKPLADLKPSKGRGARAKVHLPDGGSFTLIDESYNASPAAMKAAFNVLGHSAIGEDGRRIAILGDMLELGRDGPSLHANLAKDLEKDHIDRVFTVGPIMKHLKNALPADRQAGHSLKSEEMVQPVLDAVQDGDVVMVKGSLGSNMAPIVQALMALDTNSNGTHKERGSAHAV